jgi:hypothetical protein
VKRKTAPGFADLTARLEFYHKKTISSRNFPPGKPDQKNIVVISIR